MVIGTNGRTAERTGRQAGIIAWMRSPRWIETDVRYLIWHVQTDRQARRQAGERLLKSIIEEQSGSSKFHVE